MYASVGQGSKAAWPIAALCCLGIIAFLIASTIVLALIPLYISKKTLTVANLTSSSDVIYAQYSAPSTSSSSQTGPMTNLDQIGQSLGVSNSASVSSASSQATVSRRRRELGFRRHKRTLQMKFLFKLTMVYGTQCITYACRANLRNSVQTKLSSISTLSNFPCSINVGGKIKTFTYTLSFIGIVAVTNRPTGFPISPVTVFQFVATKSGAFNDPTVWDSGIIPFGNCTVSILAGVTVNVPFTSMDVQVTQFNIFGTMNLGLNSASFKFTYPTNIRVQNGGTIGDLTNNKNLLLPPNSIVTVMTGGGFAAAGTVLQTYTSAGPGSSVKMSSASGPYTCGMLPGGTVVNANSVKFFAIQSGSFSSGATYLGGMAPSSEFCSAGCDMDIESGVTLSTAALNGVMSLKMNSISVLSGAYLQLGSPGSSNGFKFLNPVTLSVSGKMAFLGSDGNIMLPPNSIFNIVAGGSFLSDVSVGIQVFNPLTGAFIGSATVLGTTISGGSFLMNIGASGTPTITGTAPEAGGGGGSTATITTFKAIKSGLFTDATIWDSGVAPTGTCTVIIPAGFTVTISSATLPISMKLCDVSGTLILGANNAKFSFFFPVSIIVRNGGIITDSTSGKLVQFPVGSVITLLNGGAFGATGSVFQVSTPQGPGSSFTVTSANGPFTCGFSTSSSILTYNSVTFIAAVSGGFASGATFLGGFAPSLDICSGGCGIQVLSGITLSTDDLNGVMNININSINVPVGAFLKLGTPGSSSGFKFMNTISLSIAGQLSFVASGGAIMLPFSSVFSILATGSFSSAVSVTLSVFNVATGIAVGTGYTLGTSISGGAFQVNVSATGTITTGSGGSGTTTTSPILYSTALLG